MNVSLNTSDKSWSERLFGWFIARFWVLFVATSFMFLLISWLGLIGIPRRLQIPYLALICGIPFGVLAGYRINGYFPEPQYHYVNDVEAPGAADDDAALYEFPETDFQQLEVKEDSLEDWATRLHAGKGVDKDALTVEEGTWPASKTDRELMEDYGAIQELRTQLEEDAKIGFAYKTQGWGIVRNAVTGTFLSLVDTLKAAELPDEGQSLDDAVDGALEQFDLDRDDDGDQEDGDDVEDDLDDAAPPELEALAEVELSNAVEDATEGADD
ncbi:hypothetical protein GCM10028857_05120 [Salinarchaeum chitinilyticum]